MSSEIKTAIERIKLASKMAQRYMGAHIYVCISGGKDSSVIQQLVIDSGVEAVFIHNHTTVDAPETVHFVRKEFKRLEKLGYKIKILYPKLSMWKLIEKHKGMPPTRLMRYCCAELKENSIYTDEGRAAFIVTGVRWSESAKRKGRGEFEVLANSKSDRIILSNDNDVERKLFEDCKLKNERVCNPIIDWEDDDVWRYIRDNHLPYNPLYDLGFARVGCIGCPMATPRQRARQWEIWPKYKQAYIAAIERGIAIGKAEGREYTFRCGEDALKFIDGTFNPNQKELFQ